MRFWALYPVSSYPLNTELLSNNAVGYSRPQPSATRFILLPGIVFIRVSRVRSPGNGVTGITLINTSNNDQICHTCVRRRKHRTLVELIYIFKICSVLGEHELFFMDLHGQNQFHQKVLGNIMILMGGTRLLFFGQTMAWFPANLCKYSLQPSKWVSWRRSEGRVLLEELGRDGKEYPPRFRIGIVHLWSYWPFFFLILSKMIQTANDIRVCYHPLFTLDTLSTLW